MEARQRGEAMRIVTLAYQIEVMVRDNPKRMKPLQHYLKPLQRKRGAKADQSEALAAMLDRRAVRDRAKAAKQSSVDSPASQPARAGKKKGD